MTVRKGGEHLTRLTGRTHNTSDPRCDGVSRGGLSTSYAASLLKDRRPGSGRAVTAPVGDPRLACPIIDTGDLPADDLATPCGANRSGGRAWRVGAAARSRQAGPYPPSSCDIRRWMLGSRAHAAGRIARRLRIRLRRGWFKIEKRLRYSCPFSSANPTPRRYNH